MPDLLRLMRDWRKYSMSDKKKYFALLLSGGGAIALVIVLGIMLGSVYISAGDIIDVLLGRSSTAIRGIIVYSRIPRIAASLLAGAALSVSGAVLQQILANKLASPSVVGVNAGAGLGVTVAAAFGVISGLFVSVFAFLGSLLAVILISLVSRASYASKASVILAGVALNAMLGAVSESISVLDDDVALMTAEFRVGGFSSVSYLRLVPAGIIIVASLAFLFLLLNELDVISLGDETARGVGLSVKKYRILFLIIAALLAGASVSFAGLLGFVGLIVPHFVRSLVGSESRRLIPLSAIYGAAFVSFCDILSRFLFAPYELPVGILLSIIGCPVFVWIILKAKGERADA